MKKHQYFVTLSFLVFSLSSLFTLPVAYAEQEDYLQLLKADLDKITDAMTSGSSTQAENQPSAASSNTDKGKKTTTQSRNKSENDNPSSGELRSSLKGPTGNKLITQEKSGLADHQHKIEPIDKTTMSVPSESGLIKKDSKFILNDVNFFKEFIAGSRQSSAGYYYKIKNEGSGRNACAGDVKFFMRESNVKNEKISEGTFNIKCNVLPAVIGDALGKIKKNGKIEVLTSAYQIYGNQAIKNGYKNNSLLRYSLASLN